jgi:hypothetical protein
MCGLLRSEGLLDTAKLATVAMDNVPGDHETQIMLMQTAAIEHWTQEIRRCLAGDKVTT